MVTTFLNKLAIGLVKVVKAQIVGKYLIQKFGELQESTYSSNCDFCEATSQGTSCNLCANIIRTLSTCFQILSPETISDLRSSSSL